LLQLAFVLERRFMYTIAPSYACFSRQLPWLISTTFILVILKALQSISKMHTYKHAKSHTHSQAQQAWKYGRELKMSFPRLYLATATAALALPQAAVVQIVAGMQGGRMEAEVVAVGMRCSKAHCKAMWRRKWTKRVSMRRMCWNLGVRSSVRSFAQR